MNLRGLLPSKVIAAKLNQTKLGPSQGKLWGTPFRLDLHKSNKIDHLPLVLSAFSKGTFLGAKSYLWSRSRSKIGLSATESFAFPIRR